MFRLRHEWTEEVTVLVQWRVSAGGTIRDERHGTFSVISTLLQDHF